MHTEVEGFKKIIEMNCTHLELPPPPNCPQCNKIVTELNEGFTEKVYTAARELIKAMEQ